MELWIKKREEKLPKKGKRSKYECVLLSLRLPILGCKDTSSIYSYSFLLYIFIHFSWFEPEYLFRIKIYIWISQQLAKRKRPGYGCCWVGWGGGVVEMNFSCLKLNSCCFDNSKCWSHTSPNNLNNKIVNVSKHLEITLNMLT